MTSRRVARCSDTMETMPYAISGNTAATASNSANRVVMCRMKRRMGLIAVLNLLLHARRPPETKVDQDVPPFVFSNHIEFAADRPCAFAPGEEEHGRIIHDCALKGRD